VAGGVRQYTKNSDINNDIMCVTESGEGSLYARQLEIVKRKRDFIREGRRRWWNTILLSLEALRNAGLGSRGFRTDYV